VCGLWREQTLVLEVMQENTQEQQTPELLRWQVHPARESGLKALLLCLFLLAVLCAVQVVYQKVFWTVLSALLLTSSLAGFFLPTRYEMDSSGVTVSRLWFRHHQRWDRFRSFCIDKRGVLLSPFDRPNRLENYRGSFLLVHPADQPLVLECVRRHLREMERNS